MKNDDEISKSSSAAANVANELQRDQNKVTLMNRFSIAKKHIFCKDIFVANECDMSVN